MITPNQRILTTIDSAARSHRGRLGVNSSMEPSRSFQVPDSLPIACPRRSGLRRGFDFLIIGKPTPGFDQHPVGLFRQIAVLQEHVGKSHRFPEVVICRWVAILYIVPKKCGLTGCTQATLFRVVPTNRRDVSTYCVDTNWRPH